MGRIGRKGWESLPWKKKGGLQSWELNRANFFSQNFFCPKTADLGRWKHCQFWQVVSIKMKKDKKFWNVKPLSKRKGCIFQASFSRGFWHHSQNQRAGDATTATLLPPNSPMVRALSWDVGDPGLYPALQQRPVPGLPSHSWVPKPPGYRVILSLV